MKMSKGKEAVSKSSPMSQSNMPTSIPCTTLARAQRFYDNGMAFLEMGEDYSALMNLALAANTLTELRNLANYVQLPDKCMRVNPQLCETQRESLCNLNIAIDKILRKVHVLKKRVIEIRSSQYQGGQGSSTSKPGDCKQTENVEVKYTKESDACTKFCFERIVGAEKAKEQIQNGFVNPILYPNMYGKVSKGILLYGMPGTGKTLLAKATVSELQQQSKGTLQVVMLTPKGSDLKGKYFGETEQKIANLFECAAKMACDREKNLKGSNGKQMANVLAVIFIDEIDAVGRDREGDTSGIQSSSVNALLQAMDGVKSYSNVVVMAATNYPWTLDPAVRRRFESEVLVDLPTQSDIAKLLNMKISGLVSDIIYPGSAIKLCDDTENEEDLGDNCDRDDYLKCADTHHRYEWLKWKKLGYFKELSEDLINEISKALKMQNFSSSDLNQYFQQVIRYSAQRAMKNGFFVEGPKFEDLLTTKDKRNLQKKNIKIDGRALISTLGLTNDPWSPVKTIQDQLRNKSSEIGSTELGEIKMAPNLTTGRSFTMIKLDGRLFRNVLEDKNHFEFLPYQTDPLIRGTLIEVKEVQKDGFIIKYEQNPKVTGKVLFHIAAPVRQGKVGNNEKNNLEGLDYDFVFKEETDQYTLSKNFDAKTDKEAQTKLNKLYAIGKSDDMHALVEVSIEDLQNITKLSGIGWVNWFKSYFNSKETEQYDKKNLETYKLQLEDRKEKMSSLLQQIMNFGKFEYYILVGNDVYKASQPNVITSQFAANMVPYGSHRYMELLKQQTEITKGPMYNYDMHPLSMIQETVEEFDPVVGRYDYIIDPDYGLVQNTKIDIKQHIQSEMPGDIIERNTRYVNWNIGDTDLVDGLNNTKMTFNENKYKQITAYAKNPEKVIEELKNPRSSSE